MYHLSAGLKANPCPCPREKKAGGSVPVSVAYAVVGAFFCTCSWTHSVQVVAVAPKVAAHVNGHLAALKMPFCVIYILFINNRCDAATLNFLTVRILTEAWLSPIVFTFALFIFCHFKANLQWFSSFLPATQQLQNHHPVHWQPVWEIPSRWERAEQAPHYRQ